MVVIIIIWRRCSSRVLTEESEASPTFILLDWTCVEEISESSTAFATTVSAAIV